MQKVCSRHCLRTVWCYSTVTAALLFTSKSRKLDPLATLRMGKSSHPIDLHLTVTGKTTIIGVIGGIASGKSVVAEQLGKLGADVLHVDQIGHQVLLEPEVQQAARQRWGAQILDESGKISREAVGEIVFAPGQDCELKFLEDLTFPRITAHVREKLLELEAAGSTVVVLDAAVMLKAGWDKFCHVVVFVAAERETRRKRSLERGWTAEQFASREAAQIPVALKRSRSDVIIDNNATIDQTYQQTQEFWLSLDKFSPDTSSNS